MKRILITLMALACYGCADAQVDRLRDRMRQKAQDRLDRKADEVMDKALDEVENGPDDKKKNKGRGNSNAGQSSSGARGADVYEPKTDTKGNTDYTAFKNFDFKPGEKIIFYDDFSATPLGSDPRGWKVETPGAVVNVPGKPGNWYRNGKVGIFYPTSVGVLPESFTLELDVYADYETMSEMMGGLKIFFTRTMPDMYEFNQYFNKDPKVAFDIHPYGGRDAVHTEIWSFDKNENETFFLKAEDPDCIRENLWKNNGINRVSITRDGSRVALYYNQTKIKDIPNALAPGVQYRLMMATNLWGDGMHFTNIRLATGGINAGPQIATNKPFVTQNIYFNTNSDVIRPQSYSVLKAVADAIRNAGGKVLITGHTDSDGSDADNLTLSKKRAESVRRALVNEFGLDANLLLTDGKGEAEPIDKNNTAQGKANNRRVAFSKVQ